MSNMRSTKTATAKFIPAKKAKKFKAHPLVSSGPAKEEVIESLSVLSDDIELAIKHEIRKIVSDNQIQVEVSAPTEETPKKKGTVQIAFLPEHPEDRALMAVPPQSFGSLSELFFGGTPAEITNKELSSRPVTDTEKRLATRLFDAYLNTICEAFQKPSDSWKQQWLEKPKPESVAWTTIKIATEAWDFQVHFGWPFLLMDHQESDKEKAPVDLREDLESILLTTPLSLKTEIVKERINIGDVATLKKGDILPISLPSTVKAKTGDNTIISGQVKEKDGHLCLQIEHNKVGVFYE